MIVSNHIPELPHIVDSLGFTRYIEATFTSALTGYEKPHPRAFFKALGHVDYPRAVWMVGDNIEVDVLGAENAGIPAILVRGEDARAVRSCPDLSLLPSFLCSQLHHPEPSR